MRALHGRSSRFRSSGKSRKISACENNIKPPIGSPNNQISLGDLSDNLGYRIRRAQLWVFKDIGQALARFRLSPAQFSVLTVVDANPGINQLTVSSALSIERAGLGRLVDRLERQGLIRRGASSANRRYYSLQLTTKGVALLRRIRPIIARREDALAELLGRKLYRELMRALSVFLEK
ncbi:MAG TPA: MarR family transcriptional regulator [Candidatus Acidoferrales bacterium]|nr:MarR family transcriptional regulator [Candidatus Acidoferrales bacterium]